MAKTPPPQKRPQDSRQAKIQAAQKAAGSGSANKIVIAGVVAILAIIAVVGGVIWNKRSADKDAGSGNTTPPAGATAATGYRSFQDVTLADGAPVVTIYEDFQCPACKQYEAAMGATITELAKAGKIELRYHIMNFLDARANGNQSTSVANGAFCAADQGKWQEFHDAAYAGQFPEGDSVSVDQISAFAKTAGVGDLDAWTTCTKAGKYTHYINASNEEAGTAGVNGTPTIRVGETMYSGDTIAPVTTPEGLEKVVADATK